MVKPLDITFENIRCTKKKLNKVYTTDGKLGTQAFYEIEI